ncbi:unnamed protein product [Parnassius apollo]|uniref:(apollo) hypothetical protein n=1 Tax=Parnassius apollo TaxID=110799 RepID=A0A8S3WPM2_PARAO|nr:unnamed protein product [Parnassius apollo]
MMFITIITSKLFKESYGLRHIFKIYGYENGEPSTSSQNTRFEVCSMNTPFPIDNTDSDIIEDSLDEPKHSTDNKKVYNILKNVSSGQNYKDFSSGSDNVFVPESPLSSSSSSIREQSDRTRLEDHIPTRNQRKSEDLEENNKSRKRKIFPPKENKSKKRSRNELSWKKKSAAVARAKGEEYMSYKGVKVPKKTIQEGILCHEKCRLKCSSKFSLEDRQSILNSYYSLDSNSKNALLFSSIISKPVARQCNNARNHKSASYKYYVKNKEAFKKYAS